MIIKSLLDTDWYKITMAQAVYYFCANLDVQYEFINRSPEDKFPEGFDRLLKQEILDMSNLRLSVAEQEWLVKQNSIYPEFVEWFRQYKYKPEELTISLNDGKLSVTIEGKWLSTIFWEVPLLAAISELYYQTNKCHLDINYLEHKIDEKKSILKFDFVDFGTRRRYSYHVQDIVVWRMNQLKNHFLGTSNPLLAMKNLVKPIGTYAHEAIMAMQAGVSVDEVNNFWLQIWARLYGKSYSLMLTDTLTTDYFLKTVKDINFRLADGVRLDSGDPIAMGWKIINHYKKLGINPKNKAICWSDNLNPEKAKEIYEEFQDVTHPIFGIGTNLTNDCGHKPLNIVIKMTKCGLKNVIKLSDDEGKETGNKTMIDLIKKMYINKTIK
jgi:nicotinate phosphoribosyltransferase